MNNNDKKRRRNVLNWLLYILCVLLGFVFISSGFDKIRFPYQFLSSIYDYELTGPKLGEIAAMIIPWIELVLGICLVSKLFIGGTLFISSILLVIFVFVKASALHRGLDISCGCFSLAEITSNSINYTSLIGTILIMIMCFGLLLLLVVFPKHCNQER
jgi:uncharacterized membrane protein YphA (DoxX/SURF4 family)